MAQDGLESSEISRKDEIWRGPTSVITIAGGKLTGYRKMAAGVLEHVGAVLGGSLAEPPTEEDPLPGGDFPGDLAAWAGELAHDFEIDERQAERLAGLYGSEAPELLRLDSRPIVGQAPVVAGEVEWAVRYEGAVTLEDVLYRRMRVAIYEPECCPLLVEPVARRLAALLSWDDARLQREIAEVNERLRRDLDFSLEGATP